MPYICDSAKNQAVYCNVEAASNGNHCVQKGNLLY
jgi:hypothetical protein